MVKLDAGGALQWSRTVGGPNEDDARSIIQTADGGYVIAGSTYSFGGGNADIYIVKFSGSGELLWTRTIGGTGSEQAQSIIRTTGGYVAAGYTFSFGEGSSDLYIVKLDPDGTLQWNKTKGGALDDGANSIIRTTDGGYIAAGTTNSFGAGYDFYIVKFDSSGNTCGSTGSPTPFTNSGGIEGTPNPTVTSPTPTVTSPATFAGAGGVVHTICLIGIKPISNEVPKKFALFQNYPNPFNSNSKIKYQIATPPQPSPKERGFGIVRLVVFDVLGREVATLVNELLKPGTYEVVFDGSKYPSGVYYYKLTTTAVAGSSTESFSETKRMVLLK
jgi:hypothetical protein